MTDYQPWTGARLDSLAGKVDLLAEQTGDYARLYQRVADVAAALDTAVETLTTRIDQDARDLGVRVAALEDRTAGGRDELRCGDVRRDAELETQRRDHAALATRLREYADATGSGGAYHNGIRRAAQLVDEWAQQ